MKVFIVHAHHEPKSFNGALTDAAVQALTETGHEVRVWYVGLASPEHHLARVKARVRKGGHDIPEADIRRRFDQSRLQLIQLLPHLAELRVYDNTDEADPHQGIAPRPRLVLHWQAGRVLAPADALIGDASVEGSNFRTHCSPFLIQQNPHKRTFTALSRLFAGRPSEVVK